MSSPAEYSGHPHPELEETQGQEKRAKIDGGAQQPQQPPSAGGGGGGGQPPQLPSGGAPYGGGGGYPHHAAAHPHHGGYYGYPPSHEYGASPGGGQGGYHGGPPPPHDYYGYHPHHPHHPGYGGEYGPPPPHGGSPGYYSQASQQPPPQRHHPQGYGGGAPQFGVQPRIGHYGEGGGGRGESFESRPEKPSGEGAADRQQPAQPPGLGGVDSPSGQQQGALDSRSPEGSRNLNNIEERMAGSPSVGGGSSPKTEPPSSEGEGTPSAQRPQLALQPPLTEEAAAAGDAARQEHKARKEEAGQKGEGGGEDAPKRDGAPKSESEDPKAASEGQVRGGAPQPPAGQQPRQQQPPHYDDQGYYPPPPHGDYGPPPMHGHHYYPPYYPPPSHDQHQAHHPQGPPPPIHQGYADGYGGGHPLAHYGAPAPPPGYGPPPHPSQPRDPDFGRRRNKTQKALPAEAARLVDQDVEYCHNTDRPTYLLSTPYDGGSLSDRQCYVRSHFVELFIAGPEDTVSRHSRGNQRLFEGQIGLRCAYCAKLRPADRAERAICYPSSISRMYQTVADMQRFHFESCPAIPQRIRQIYRSLKTTRPRGQGSPQAYWAQSARDIGLTDTNVDGGKKQNIKVGSMQLLSMQLKVESGLTVTEDGRLRAEAMQYGHAPPPPANQGSSAAAPQQQQQQQQPQGGGQAGASGTPPSTVSFPVKHEYPAAAGYGGPGEYGSVPPLPHGDGRGYGGPAPAPGGYVGPAPQTAAGLAPPLLPPPLAPPVNKMEEGGGGAAVVSSPGSDTEGPKSALSTPSSPGDRKVQGGGAGGGGAQADDAEMLLLLKNTPDTSPQEDDAGAGRGASMEGAPVLENCTV